jgi:hypothetical protein
MAQTPTTDEGERKDREHKAQQRSGGNPMAQAPTTDEGGRKDREPEKTERLQAVVVDLGRGQSPKQVRRLRKGRGKLMRRIDEIVDELAAAGTVKPVAQPVIVIVRERVPLPWPFSRMPVDFDDDGG